ncbi:MAG: glycoside hydrolase family 140 protein [Capsulimonadales bacterium]|nr:glycoside hydrolase family 140 protein [Capsulimonadales bacterium]
MQRIRLSENRRFLVREDGTPFFYLADTAWELFHRCTRGEAEWYLRDRAAKRFTAIQAVVLAESDGLNEPNSNGDVPLIDQDPTRPNEAYFRHVDAIVEIANRLGLVLAMLPTWGDKWNKQWGKGPEVFTPDNARIYGEFLGKRYRDADLIWVLGGDRPVKDDQHRAIVTAMAEGVSAGDGGTHLRTFHPVGGSGSANLFHDADWLDFNMWQSGHGRNSANYGQIAEDYARTPVKPVLDGEPGYEDHPAGFDLNNGYLEEYDNRKAIYWATFAGACGHTYGCHPIWQMWTRDREPYSFCRRPWFEAVALPGSGQMRHARALLESRPYLSRIPDQKLIVSDPGAGTHHVRATRDIDGRYALVYFPSAREAEIDLTPLHGSRINVFWYDPRTGGAEFRGQIDRAGTGKFTPPSTGPDWVLVLDDASQNFVAPGAR